MRNFLVRTPFLCVVMALSALSCNYVDASVASVIDDVIRKAAKVGDDVPVTKADDLVEEMAKSQGMVRAADDALSAGNKGAARSTDDILRGILRGTPESTLTRQLDELPEAARKVALVQMKGASQIGESIPEVLTRARILANGGDDALFAAGAYGDRAVKVLLEFDEMLGTGQIVIREGMPAVTTASLGRLVSQKGKAALDFWNNYIRPNWKPLAASGLIAWYVVDPDSFMDTTGAITQKAVQLFGEIAGTTVSSAVAGAAEGGGRAVRDIVDAVRTHIFASWENVVGFSLVLLVVLAILCRLFAPVARGVALLLTGIKKIYVYFAKTNKVSKEKERRSRDA